MKCSFIILSLIIPLLALANKEQIQSCNNIPYYLQNCMKFSCQSSFEIKGDNNKLANVLLIISIIGYNLDNLCEVSRIAKIIKKDSIIQPIITGDCKLTKSGIYAAINEFKEFEHGKIFTYIQSSSNEYLKKECAFKASNDSN